MCPGVEANVPLKNTAAAEKMEHPAALSNRVGRGGRDVSKWGKLYCPTLKKKGPLREKDQTRVSDTPIQKRLRKNMQIYRIPSAFYWSYWIVWLGVLATMNTLPGWARTTNQSHQPFEHTLTNQIIWPWTDAYYGHTGSMDADLYGTELATAILSNNLTLQTYKWENSSHTWTAKKGDEIQIGYRVFNINVIISRHPLIQTVRQPPFTQIVIRDKTESKIAQTRCESETCWYAFTATQPVSIVCLGGTRSGNQAISFRFPLNIQEETITTTTHAPKETTQTTHTVPTQPTVVLSPRIFKIGPYAIRNTGK
ncbi:uncharacterized protein LOC141917677 [Strix aluco]|uniref:uncharacterized protein LOC141917677 n=1 Tax=Strix aluco TaxID=111821 RepID=UPI003DA2B4CB